MQKIVLDIIGRANLLLMVSLVLESLFRVLEVSFEIDKKIISYRFSRVGGVFPSMMFTSCILDLVFL